MGKLAFADRGFFIGLVTSGLLALTIVGVALPNGTRDTAACPPYRAAPSSSMAARSNLVPRYGEDNPGEHQLLTEGQLAPDSEPGLLPTLSLTDVPGLPFVETLIPETPELSLPTVEPPALPTMSPIFATSVPAPSATATPTVTATASDGEPNRQRLLLLGGIGLALLCSGGILVGGVLFLVLRRRGKRATPGDAAPAPVAEGQAMLIAPGIDPIGLRPGLTTIGRSEDNDIIIEDRQVSRYHARIECAENVCTVEDLQSSNGCFVNGERVSRTVLTSGDRLRIGEVTMTYRAPKDHAPSAWLEIKGERYPLPAHGSTIGRSADNDIHLADPLASRKHARVESRRGTPVLIDLESANGTFVNGQRVQQHPLRDGDEIRIGSTRMTFHGQTRR